MKFFFSKTDNLYKIFKTIEKIPASRKVEIFIDPEHTLFENEWWGKQINETLSKKHIEATFVTKSKKNKEYYETVGLKVDFQGEQIVKKIFSIVSAFLFDIKKFHLYAYETKRYMFLLLSFLELGLVVAIVWFVASLIIPNATIKINPAEEREPIIYNFRYYPNNDTTNIEETRYLNVPYYTGSLDYEYELSISTLNIKHITSPSNGYLKVFNTKEQGYSLIAGTRFITHEGVVFKALENFYLATGSVDEPSETIVQVQADEFDEREQIIGIRGNIIKGTELLIRNLTESRETKEIRAESIDNFQGGNTESLGSITQEDIDLLSGKLVNQMYKQKLDVVSKNFPITGGLFLDFESITRTQFNNIQIESQVGDKTPFVKGKANVTYFYTYVLKSDLLKIFDQFLQERSTETTKISHLIDDSIVFIKDSLIDENDIKKNGDIYIIPTQIDYFQEYDFSKDINGILPRIKNLVAGMEVNKATRTLLSEFSEIGNLNISLSPMWHTSIPSIKSRIKIEYE